MRGRTNITQRKEPYVNGQVINAIVEQGNNISTGDFVEYKLVSSVEESSANTGSVIQTLKTTLYDVILIVRNSISYLELWRRSDNVKIDSTTINSTGSGVSYALAELADDTHVIVFDRATASHKYFEITSNGFNLIQSLNNNPGTNPTAIGVIDSTHYILLAKSSASGNPVTVSIYTFDSTAIAFDKTESISQDITYKIQPTKCKKVSNGRILMYGNAGSTPVIQLVGFDSNYAFTRMSNTAINITLFKAFVDVNDKVFAFLGNSGSSLYTYLSIYGYDAGGDAVLQYLRDYNLDNIFGHVTDSSTYRGFMGQIDENKLAIQVMGKPNSAVGNKIAIATFDNGTKQTSVSNAISLDPTYIGLSSYVISSVNKSKFITNDSKEVSLDIIDGEYSLLPDTNYVKSYTGGKAIGFAKTGGSAGQNVKIYTPIT